MIEELLVTGVLVAGAVGGFGLACKAVKDWSGCSEEEAAQKIHDLVNRTPKVPMGSDTGYYEELCQGLNNIIGEKRYSELVKNDTALRASGHTPVIACGTKSGLTCVTITVRPNDESEQQMIEAVMVGITRKNLLVRGLDPQVLVVWNKRMDINSPYLEIQFGESKKQCALVRSILADELRQLEADTNDRDF